MFEQLRFLAFGWRDAIEIIVVAYGVYRLLLLLHGTRAVQMLIGIVVLVLTYALAWVFKFTMIAYLLATIFTPYSPLHDGAVIIRGDTIIGAGCILPLSQSQNLDRTLGT